jgi:hypothetical protein
MGNFYQAVSSNKAVSGFLLDLYTNSSVAYSLRKLRTAYTGDCIEVYNGTSYADIGFDSNNVLDLTALGNHCGSNNGFVSKWYSQSSSANTASVTGSDVMPQIYDGSAGAVLTENSKPAVKYISGYNRFTLTNDLSLSDAHFFNVSSRYGDRRGLWDSGSNRYVAQAGNGGAAGTGDLYSNGQNLGVLNKSEFAAFMGTSQAAYNSVQSLSGTQNIGSDQNGMHNTQEIIIFDDDMSSSRADIENRINAFYNTY